MIQSKLFSDKQFGFISGRSTTLQLLIEMEEWTEIRDNGGTLDSIYMDFMKAFDNWLLRKLRSYGLSEQWVEDCLRDRSQKVSE
jgi:hypothetical protein